MATHIRLEFRPRKASRVWQKSSLTMWAEGRDNMRAQAVDLSKAQGWYDWRIVDFTP